LLVLRFRDSARASATVIHGFAARIAFTELSGRTPVGARSQVRSVTSFGVSDQSVFFVYRIVEVVQSLNLFVVVQSGLSVYHTTLTTFPDGPHRNGESAVYQFVAIFGAVATAGFTTAGGLTGVRLKRRSATSLSYGLRES